MPRICLERGTVLEIYVLALGVTKALRASEVLKGKELVFSSVRERLNLSPVEASKLKSLVPAKRRSFPLVTPSGVAIAKKRSMILRCHIRGLSCREITSETGISSDFIISTLNNEKLYMFEY